MAKNELFYEQFKFALALLEKRGTYEKEERIHKAFSIASDWMNNLGYVYSLPGGGWVTKEEAEAKAQGFWAAFDTATDYRASSRDKAAAREALGV